MTTDIRLSQLKQWLTTLGQPQGLLPDTLTPASSDASFRRYFRLLSESGSTYIVMDAPPDREDTEPFVKVAKLLEQAKVNAPRVLQASPSEGFLLLSDLGNTTYLSALSAKTAPKLYLDASKALVQMQLQNVEGLIPAYNKELLTAELMLFPQWYLEKHLQIQLSDQEAKALIQVFEVILSNNLGQPQVFVHRDYHSRNLMVTTENNPGVLDFQDAVIGPITYDLVSLYRDAYIEWEEAQQMDWVIRYWDLARQAGLPVNQDFGEFYKDFEWMGLQRHLKVLGIFARLYHRDGKDGYLKDIPLVLKYTRKVAERYADFKPLVHILDKAEGITRPEGLTF